MPFPSRPMLLSWGGQFGTVAGAGDIWQCGLHFGMASAAQPDLPTSAELATLYNGALATFHSGANTHLNKGAKLQWIKAVILTEAGRYATEPVTFSGATVDGYVDDTNGSPASSLVISLSSGLRLGAGNHGRFYLPWFAAGAWPANGRLVASVVEDVAENAQTWLNAAVAWAHGAIGADNGLRIYSAVGGGSKKLVTTMSVGDVVDVQRRRRNRLKETYTALALTNA